MFKRVLIANRGEIAVRIMRTLREMGIASVAAFSDADRDALFVQEADEAYHLGPAAAAESYLNVDAIVEVAREAQVDAIHPGYGFLAENARFAEGVAAAGMTFIGPSPEAMQRMGDKVAARRLAESLGVPVVPGSPGPVRSLEEARACAAEIGFPVAVKAAGGGGGRGIRVVERIEDLAEALERASREAEAYFKNPEVYLERYFPDPRHVEIQVLGDRHGTLVHLGERDCSVQRRHQKLIEETPGPAVDRELRARMGETAMRAAAGVGYTSAGTVEFLLSREGEFFFLEMNTRIQVEHPITEEISGLDLIREMVLIAAGEPMSVSESLLDPRGHAMEVRINAEDPREGFRPTPTTIREYRVPGGPGIRVDSGVYAGFTVPSEYDSLLAKLIAWAPDRDLCRRRMQRALGELRIVGPSTTVSFARAVLASDAFIRGDAGTTFVERALPDLLQENEAPPVSPDVGAETSRDQQRTFEVEVNRKLFTVRVAEIRSASPKQSRKRPARAQDASDGTVISPMHGTVIAIKKGTGDAVEQGETLFVIEAMKMENEISAPRSGVLRDVSVESGATVESGQQLGIIA
jgi:acetyl-CoA/propionyl-CoA carboxylase biotin carboxyl carrier protein